MLSDGSVVASKTIADFLSLDREREKERESTELNFLIRFPINKECHCVSL